jgi:uncharacterized protein (TIGR02444 family)
VYRFQTRQESQDIAQSLWHFSLELWRHGAVQQELLTLQDEHGANINALLFAAWLALEGQCFVSDSVTHSGLSDWNASMTAPLRALRRQAKNASSELYQCLKNAELASERHEQALLVATLDQHAPTKVLSRETLMQANLVSYLHTLVTQGPGPTLQHCQTLLQMALNYLPPTPITTDQAGA